MKKIIILLISILSLTSCSSIFGGNENKKDNIIIKDKKEEKKDIEEKEVKIIKKEENIKDCIIKYNSVNRNSGKKKGESIVFNFGKDKKCNFGKNNIKSVKWGNGLDHDPNSLIKAENVFLDNINLSIINEEKIINYGFSQLIDEFLNGEFKIKSGELLKYSLIVAYKNGNSFDDDYKKYIKESNIDKIFINIKVGDYFILIPLKNIKKYNAAKEKFKNIIKLFNNVEIKKEDLNVNKQVDNGKFSNSNLVKEGYKINNLGKIKEYYKTFILNENNGYYRNQTIYKEGNKILSFGLTYSHGTELEISSPIHKTIDLSDYGNVGQPIFGKYESKIIIIDLKTIKIINKKKGINKILWKG